MSVSVDPRGRARPVRAQCGLFILRVEPSSVRKDILHIPQHQLNLRHLSSTAAVSTQNWIFLLALDFHAERLIKCLCRLTSALGSRRFPRSMDIVPSLRVLPSCFRSRLRRVQLVRCFPLRCTLLVQQHVPMCPPVRR